MRTRPYAKRDGLGIRELMVVLIILLTVLCVGSLFMFHSLSQSYLGRSKVDVRAIEKACEAYRNKYGKFPPDLESLITGAKPYLEGGEEAISDPWGRRYQYDPSGPHSNGAKPDIFAVEPDGETIGNWPSHQSN